MWVLQKQQKQLPAYQCAKQQRNLGPSASSSNSNPVSNNTQSSIQGGAGAITTVTAGSGVNYNDPALQLGTVAALSDVVKAALTGLNTTSQAVAQIGAQQQASSSDLVQQAINSNAALAAYQGTSGGLNPQTTNNTKFLILGGVGIAALAVLAIIVGAFRRS